MSDTAQEGGETVLTIDVIGFPPGSCRGVTQTLKPIQEAASFRRTVNFNLKNTAPTLARKYATEISCTDTNAPCLAGIFPGVSIVIGCASVIYWPTVGGDPGRPIVEGSTYTVGDYTAGRPILACQVTDFSLEENEAGATVGWRMTAEET